MWIVGGLLAILTVGLGMYVGERSHRAHLKGYYGRKSIQYRLPTAIQLASLPGFLGGLAVGMEPLPDWVLLTEVCITSVIVIGVFWWHWLHAKAVSRRHASMYPFTT